VFTLRSGMNLYIQFMFTLVHKDLGLLETAYNEICHNSFIQPMQIHIYA